MRNGGCRILMYLMFGAVLALRTNGTGGTLFADDAHSEIARYRMYLEALRTLSFEFDYTTYESGGAIGPEKLIAHARGSVGVRGDEFRFYRRQRYLIWRAGRFQPHDMESEEIFTKRRRLHVQANHPFDSETFNLMELAPADGKLMVVTWEKAPHVEVGSIGPIQNAVYGFLPDDGGRYVVDFMESGAHSELSDDVLDGVPLTRIFTSGAYGRYSVWLDSALGDAPRRIELRKGADDFFSGGALSSYPLGDPKDRQPHA